MGVLVWSDGKNTKLLKNAEGRFLVRVKRKNKGKVPEPLRFKFCSIRQEICKK